MVLRGTLYQENLPWNSPVFRSLKSPKKIPEYTRKTLILAGNLQETNFFRPILNLMAINILILMFWKNEANFVAKFVTAVREFDSLLHFFISLYIKLYTSIYTFIPQK